MSDPQPENPYAAPGAELEVTVAKPGAWSSGKFLVVPKGWISPPICLFTGATGPLTRLRQGYLSYLNPLWLFLLLLGPLVLILVGLFVTKKGTIYYVLSEDCARRRKRRSLVNWIIFLGGLALAVVGAELDAPWLLLAGPILVIVSAVLAATWCRLIKTAKIEGDSIWLSGIPTEVQEIILKREQKKFARKQAELRESLRNDDKRSQALPW